MVEELGFTALAAETGYSEGRLVDAYIRGQAGVDDVDKVVVHAFSWIKTPLEENRQLIEWMREYNARPSTTRQLRYYGIDLTGGRMGVVREPQPAIEDALDYIERVDLALSSKLREQFAPILASFPAPEFQHLDAAGRDQLTAGIAALVATLERNRVRFIDADGEEAYAAAHRSALVARQIEAVLRVHPGPDAMRDGGDLTAAQNARDAAMAANLRWVLQREGADGRVFAFAHNGHVRKGPANSEAFPEYFPPDAQTATMGEVLGTMIGNQMVVIGSTFGGGDEFGPPQDGSIEALLGELGLPVLALDLRAASPPVALTTPRGMRVENRYADVNLPSVFDALVYIHRATPVRPRM